MARGAVTFVMATLGVGLAGCGSTAAPGIAPTVPVVSGSGSPTTAASVSAQPGSSETYEDEGSYDDPPTDGVAATSDPGQQQVSREVPAVPSDMCSVLRMSATARKIQDPKEWSSLPLSTYSTSWTGGCAAQRRSPSLGMKLEGFSSAEDASVRGGAGASWATGRYVDGHGDAAYVFDRADEDNISQAVMSVGKLRIEIGFGGKDDAAALKVLDELEPTLRSMQ